MQFNLSLLLCQISLFLKIHVIGQVIAEMIRSAEILESCC